MAEEGRERAQREFAEGLDNIAKGLIEAAGAAGVNASREDVRLEPEWQPGRSIPEAVRMTLAAPDAPLMQVDFSREQVEDCWRDLDRPEVRQKMREVTDRYRRLRGART